LNTCLVIPTYNEKENIRRVVEAIKGVNLHDLTLLFVDDNSPDGTADEIRSVCESEPWVKLLERDAKKGIGSAYTDGFRRALLEERPDVLIEMDADLQHPPQALPALLDAIQRGADVAIASRYTEGGGIEEWGGGRRMLSRGANTFARMILGLKVKDCTSGIRAYRRVAVERIVNSRLPAKGFEFQVATLYLLKTDAKMVEVPYSFGPRRAGKSKLDALDVVRFFVNVVGMSIRGIPEKADSSGTSTKESP
jgi:dolichol-phosphate mannosyltransferase